MKRTRIRGRALAVAIVPMFVLLFTPTTFAASEDGTEIDGAQVNAVVAWDLNAQTAIWDIAGQQPPQVAGRSFAMVDGAIYDAVNAIAGSPYQPYLTAPRANGTESTDAAVATAAHRVLLFLFPDQEERLRAQYREWLAGLPNGRAKHDGIKVGAETAAAMIRARANDGTFGDRLWSVGTEPGQWRPTPPGFVNSGAWLVDLRPFLIPDPAMFRTAGPPTLTSRTYARDFNEVKQIGSATSTIRTADQTEAAIWWQDSRNPHWEIKRQLAVNQDLNTLETARLFALAEMTGTDATIACSDSKEFWSFWRPVTAISLAGTDGNPRTTADPNWTPLLVTPPIPEYPSGHACGTGARMATYRHFFGSDGIPFSAFSVDTGTTRHFNGFAEATAELVEARIWGGIHFRTSDLDGASLGRAVADHTTAHHFQPWR